MCEDKMNWILDDLAVGSVQAGGDLDMLTKNGITVIVCALPELPLPLEEYKRKGFSMLHIPVDDYPLVNIGRWFDDVTHFIMIHRLQNRKTLVHCAMGISRSASLACAYLMNLFHCDEVKALRWLRDKRYCVNVNPGFYRQLVQYGKKYK